MSFLLRRQMMLSRCCITSFQTAKVVPILFHTFTPQLASDEAGYESATLNPLKEDSRKEAKNKKDPQLFQQKDVRDDNFNMDAFIEPEGESSAAGETEEHLFNTLIYDVKGKVANITLNRPYAKNAISREMYREIPAALRKADRDKNVTIAVITGNGDFYSSGNDISNFKDIPPRKLKTIAEESGVVFRKFVQSFIDFTKPLVAAVNGPVIGIACTTLGLCDVVYASDAAYFYTPFPAIGITPEGCSSYTFPKIMGSAKANEILLFGKKFTAQEAKERCLVTDVFPKSKFHSEVSRRIKEYSKLPPLSSVASKRVIRHSEKEVLTKVNKNESDMLVKMWQTQDFLNAMNSFLSRQK